MLFLWIVWIICNFSRAEDRQGYLVAAPSVFRSGVEEVVSVTIFNATTETKIQLQLAVKGETVAHGHGTVLDKGTVKIQLPSGLRGQAHLKVWGNRHLTEGGFIFHNSTTVTVDSKGSSVFIQTDKPVYKPKQKVLINMFMVTPDLRPTSEKIEAYILDPRGSRIIQWTDLRPICCGVVNMSFPLSDQPVFGEWLIFAETQGHAYNKSFSVQKYVLPKFELVISPPSYVRDIGTCEKGNVKARYTFGKPVKGLLTINMTITGVGYYKHEIGLQVLKTMEIYGSAVFDICAKDMMPVDFPEHFRGTVNIWATVISVDGSKQVTFDDTTPVQKQLIDIKYTKDTKKQFKPGLPYQGKVEVTYPDGSPADGVTVQIKAELTPKDNVYTSELVSQNGLVEFQIPSIPTGAQYVWLETKVMAIDGKPAGEQYLPNYLSISSWYSPSKCHLLIQPPEKPLLVGEEARIALKSTCPCNFTLHYELVSRGNIVFSGQQPGDVTLKRSKRDASVTFDKDTQETVTHTASTQLPNEDSTVWLTFVHFTVTHNMAPLSRILVYYVRENGEGVTDSAQIPIKPVFENQVSLTLSTNNSRPGDAVDIKVKAAKGSCVCVSTVDKSVYLLRNGFQLTPGQIFQELSEFDVSDVYGTGKDEGHFWWPGMGSQRRRRSSLFPWHWDITKDARFAFTETGLIVMTDIVSLNHRQSGGMYTDEAVPAFQPHTGTLVGSSYTRMATRTEKRKRTFFPETWVWHCFNVSDVTGEEQLHVEVPDSITTWITEAIGISSEKGLGVAGQAHLKAFKPFFIDFTLPYHVIRGEQVKIPLTVYNYLPVGVEVHVKITIPKGIKFVGYPGKQYLIRKLCVASGETKPTSAVFAFTDLGQANISARALAFAGMSCFPEGNTFKNKHADDAYLEKKVPAGSDFVRRSLMVEPEGLAREYTYSVFFCPNEKIQISTPNKFEYQYVQKPQRMTHFDLTVKAHNDAHIALSSGPHDMAEMIEIVIGGQQNSRTWISTSKMGDPVSSASTSSVLSWDEFRAFWISWKNGVIQVGYGIYSSNDSVIVEWTVDKQPDVKFIGFSTGWGSMGEFKIWRKEETDENHNEAFTLGVPHNVIPGSERATASIIGDVMGPTVSNLDNLLRLPFGCGEQNMIHFAPNVFVLKYLQKTRQLCPEVESEAVDYLVQGYQRQLTYKRLDGSYSAFGERDSSGSMWLTAFVLKSFAQSRGFIFIDPGELSAAKDWIIQHQNKDGSFPAMGRILNKDIQGGNHGKVALTAYVAAALLETGVTSEDEKIAVSKAKLFLESHMFTVDDPYTTALTSYALTLLRSTYAPVALRKLNAMAITQDGFTHWSLTGSVATEEDTFMGFNDGLSQSVISAEVEMTAYALLTYTLMGDVASALPVVKWLSQQRNSLGGFSSTQDTCVALQALAEYAILSYVGGVNLTISLASTNLDYQETFELHRLNKKILQTARIPSIPTGLFVSAKGEGCCLMQIDVHYNVPDPVAKPAFQLMIYLKEPKLSRKRRHAGHQETHRAFPDDDDPGSHQDHQEYKITLEACTRWLHAGASNMAVLELSLLSGFRADIESLEQLLLNKQIGLKRYEIDGRKVLFYFDEIPSQCLTCVKLQAFREYIVGKTAPVPVKIYDYYEPTFEASRFYNASESSPLSRELCDGTTCNEVESSTNHWTAFSPNGPCSGAFSCPEEDHFERCMCYRDCGYDGDPVCGSDGTVYQNQCQLDVTACRNNTRIERVPMSQCTPEETVSEEATDVTLSRDQDMLPEKTEEEIPSHHAEVSYYSYEYDVDPYAAENEDNFEMGAELITVASSAEESGKIYTATEE
ncbi:C3 and PZP-like alpha-2-macroglobulin domain-containing protein 8 [Xenopus laevis]|uniref:C3 and PZP-like alpha-2-macroglobulin domain-containing protein 8 n=5 Tax=Xenopus laevis TaxID=8355 RepID=A0A8J0UYB3_XENLA|nr:C3 and PZP-like alpha-2-macroglobulin domain-containing protein 8 [Xenopus laevis]